MNDCNNPLTFCGHHEGQFAHLLSWSCAMVVVLYRVFADLCKCCPDCEQAASVASFK